jgi:DNA-binding HxlR family transcriptional regulator
MVKAADSPYLCPVEATIDVVGGKWKSVILFHLLRSPGPIRFGEFRRLLPRVTQQMLTTQLRELEADGVILRKVYAEVPPKVEYSLSDFGRTLHPIIEKMLEWGQQYEARLAVRDSTQIRSG